NRLKKLKELQDLGLDPYPQKYTPTHFAKPLQDVCGKEPLGSSEDAAAGTTPLVTVSGRLVLFRAMGKNAFAHLQDHSGRVQVMFNRDLTEVEGFTPDNPKTQESLTPMKLIEKK